MSPLAFGRFARCLAFGAFLLPACAQQAPVEPAAAPAPAPVPAPAPEPPKPRNPAKGGGGLDPFGGLLGGGAVAPAEAEALKKKYQALLIGTWSADLGDGYHEELAYSADGYSAVLTGPVPATASGKYAVLQAIGTKGLKVRLGDDPGARSVTLSFDGDALEHPSLRPGVTGTYRKK